MGGITIFTAIIMGGGKQFKANTLELLSQSLKRERYTIRHDVLKMLDKTLPQVKSKVVWGEHRLTHGEMVRKSFKPPYIGNPYKRVSETERVQIRVIYRED